MGYFNYQGICPVIDPSAYIHPDSTIIGEVTIAKQVFVGANATLRGDLGSITIHKGANIQEVCVVHSFPEKSVIVEECAHVGHGAIFTWLSSKQKLLDRNECSYYGWSCDW